MPVVSVVVPTYNRLERLERAIESVLNQRFEDLELIVVDDRSVENVEAVVEGFDDPRVRYLAHDTNRGVSAARNTGIEASRGEYIAFLDDDDEWLPHKLNRQVECLEGRSDEWVVVYCDSRAVRHGASKHLRRLLSDLLPVGSRSMQPEGGAELIPLVLAMDLSLTAGSALVVRRDAIKYVEGFDERYQCYEDLDLLIRLLRIGKLAFVDEPLVVRHESGSRPANTVRAGKNTLFTKFSTEIAEAERNGYDILGVHRFNMAKHYYTEGRFVDGTRYLVGATIDSLALLRVLCVGLYAEVTRTLRSERG